MTRQDYFVKKTKLIAQIDSAEKLGCKNVLKYSKIALSNLEAEYKKEHFSNPLFSYMVTKKETEELIRTEVKPTFKIKIVFKNGETYDLGFYHEIKKGVKHSAIEKWAVEELAKTIQHPENIVSARFIMGF